MSFETMIGHALGWNLIPLIFNVAGMINMKRNPKFAKISFVIAFILALFFFLRPGLYILLGNKYVGTTPLTAWMLIAQMVWAGVARSNTKALSNSHKSSPRKTPHQQSSAHLKNAPRNTDYSELADQIFDISLDLTNEAGDLMSSATGAARYSMSTIQTATNVGTGLYEYAVILLRKKLKTIFHDKYDFERNDNEMIEAFAKRMMMPATALLKIVDKANEKEWKQHLLELQDSIDIESYLDRVQEVLEKVSL